MYDITVQDDGDARYRAFLVDADVPTLVDTGLPDTTDALFDDRLVFHGSSVRSDAWDKLAEVVGFAGKP
ncbi:hypothetical protein [Natrinema sp. 74]|uniref:hypothetical protein n=1 Tax=Natrinema sp. 74 TaxID=3384159 RepID=UPI0038D50852